MGGVASALPATRRASPAKLMVPPSRLLVLPLFVAVLAMAAPAREAYAVAAGQPCGGPSGAVCDKGLWCEPPTGACGSRSGRCVSVPRLCFARKNGKSFQPVCGCNNKTYSNDCFRRAYRITKFHDGKC